MLKAAAPLPAAVAILRTALVLLVASAMMIVTVGGPAASAEPVNPVWAQLQAAWGEAWAGLEVPPEVTIQRLSVEGGQLVETPDTMPTDQFLGMLEGVASKFPAVPDQLPPSKFLLAGHFAPLPPVFIGAFYLGFSFFACPQITPATGIVNVPSVSAPGVGLVQYQGTLALNLKVSQQFGLALADVQLYPSLAVKPLISAPSVDSEVLILHPGSFAVCFLLFGIPLFSLTFLFLDGNLSK